MPDDNEQIAKLTAMLERHIAVTDERAARGERRERDQDQFQGYVKTTLTRLQDQHTSLVNRVSVIEGELPTVRDQARKAHDSFVSISETVDGVQLAVRDMDQKQTPLLLALAASETEKKLRREADEANAKRESDAREIIEKKREDRQRILTIGVPVIVALITTIGAVTTAYLSQSAHADTAAKLAALQRQIEQQPSPSSTQPPTPTQSTPATPASQQSVAPRRP